MRGVILVLLLLATPAMAQQGPVINNPSITGGTITGSAGTFTTLGATGVTTLASTTGTRFNSSATAAQLQINTGTSVDGPAIDWIFARMRWFGVVTGSNAASDNQISPNQFIFTDAAEVRGATVSDSAILAMTVVEGNTASLNNAQRVGINSHLVVNGQIGATPVGGVGADPQQFVSSLSYARSVASQGGLGGWIPGTDPGLGQFRGSLFAGNDLVSLQSGALNYYLVVGREIDLSITGTATSYGRFGLLIASFPSSSQAIADDAGIAIITNDNTVNNFKNGIQFAGSGSYFKVTDSLIRTVARVVPVGLAGPITVPRGIDFSSAVFTDAFLRGPSNTFVVDGSGNVTGASYKAGAAAGVSCAAGGLVPATAVVTGGIITHC